MKENIHYNKLIVNPENYRFDSVKNQEEAIDLMLKEKGVEIVNLAKHILEHGLDEAKDLRVLAMDSGEYLVLDGNRRTTAIKCLHNQSFIKDKIIRESFQNLAKTKKIIPTNIQSFIYDDEQSAAKWIKLDHTGKNNGVGQDSWGAAEKDRFAYKFEGKISPAMQAVSFVEKELNKKIDTKKLKVSTINRILSNPESRSYLGVNLSGGKLIFTVDEKESCERLNKLFDKVIKDSVTVASVYHAPQTIDFMKNLFSDKPKYYLNKKLSSHENGEDKVNNEEKKPRKTRREKDKAQKIFGKELILKNGDTNNIYMDILDLHDFYVSNEDKLSKNFPAIIRMSLRLLVESAVAEKESIDSYIKNNFAKAKKLLTQDQKTTLANNNVYESCLVQLLQTGAHNYTNSANFEQTIAMSIIIGEILDITHSKRNAK